VSENEMPSNNLSDYLDRLEKSAGSNRDTDGLGTMAAGPLVVGRVEAINGEDGKEAPEFVATRQELKQLAECWALERIEHDFNWFVTETSGSSEWRWSVYIDRRLNRLGEILGPEVMRKLFEDAAASFRRRAGLTDEDWRVFTEGTDEEQEVWRGRQEALAEPDNGMGQDAPTQKKEPLDNVGPELRIREAFGVDEL
jgi:hypothetical protein